MIEMKKDNIVKLEDNRKYVIVNDTSYGGIKYFLLMGVNEEETSVTKDIVIVEEIRDGEDVYIRPVKDQELLMILAKILKPKE